VSDQISPHLIRVIDFASKAGQWITVNEIAASAGVAKRTASQHAHKLVQSGVFEQNALFNGYRYRIAQSAPRSFFKRIEAARAAFNMEVA